MPAVTLRQLLRLAAAIAPVAGPVDGAKAVAAILPLLPEAALVAGGELHQASREWLAPQDVAQKKTSASTIACEHAAVPREARLWLETAADALFASCFHAAGNGDGHKNALHDSQACSGGESPAQHVYATYEDYELWRLHAAAWFRLHLVADEELQCQRQKAAHALAERLQALYDRTYLPPKAADRTVFLLHSALEAVEACGTAGGSCSSTRSGSPAVLHPGGIVRTFVHLVHACAEPLAAYATLTSSCFWPTDVEPAVSGDDEDGGGGCSGGRAWAEAVRAHYAMKSVAGAALVTMAGQQAPDRLPDDAIAEAEHLSHDAGMSKRAGRLLQCLTGFAARHGEQPATRKSPTRAPTVDIVGPPPRTPRHRRGRRGAPTVALSPCCRRPMVARVRPVGPPRHARWRRPRRRCWRVCAGHSRACGAAAARPALRSRGPATPAPWLQPFCSMPRRRVLRLLQQLPELVSIGAAWTLC